MELKVKAHPSKHDYGIVRVWLDDDERAVLDVMASMDTLLGIHGIDVLCSLREILDRIDAKRRLSESEYRNICIWLQSVAAMLKLAKQAKLPGLPPSLPPGLPPSQST